MNLFRWARRPAPVLTPLEFGPVADRDRFQIRATLSARGQGMPITGQALPQDVLEITGSSLDAGTITRDVFRIIRSLFESNEVKAMLRQAPIVGVMTDLMNVNGFAGRLHPDEDKHLISVTAGTMLRGLIAAYRLLGQRALLKAGPSATQEVLSRFYVFSFAMPVDRNERYLGLRCAAYGMLAVFSHELAHVLRGHTSYALHELGLDALEDPSASAQRLEGAQTDMLRLMELDADEFAGMVLAQMLLMQAVQSGRLLDDDAQRERFQQIATGVLMLYMGFGRGDGVYYSGPARARLLLRSMLEHCTREPAAEAWFDTMLQALQAEMVQAGLVTQSEVMIQASEWTEIVNVRLPACRAIESEWLKQRPWPLPGP